MPTTAEVDAIRAAIEARWSGLSDLGVYNCRRIRGKYASGNAWSQHAWGNAWDVAANPATLDAIEAWLPASGLPVGTVLRYDDHLHVEGQPARTGTPPCAGGDTGDTDADPAQFVIPPPTTPPDPLGLGREGGPTATLSTVTGAVEWLTDATNWTRLALGLGGVLIIILAVVLLVRDLAPPSTIVRAAAGAAT